MAIRKVLKEGHATLRKRSREVTAFDERLWTLLDDMAETMEVEDGVGLAAPQVGILKRIFIVDVGEGIVEYINPKIIDYDGSQTGIEGCLSCPGIRGIVTRPDLVIVKAQDRFGKFFEKEMKELGARAIFHEYDHLDGVLFVDKAEKRLTEEELLSGEYDQ